VLVADPGEHLDHLGKPLGGRQVGQHAGVVDHRVGRLPRGHHEAVDVGHAGKDAVVLLLYPLPVGPAEDDLAVFHHVLGCGGEFVDPHVDFEPGGVRVAADGLDAVADGVGLRTVEQVFHPGIDHAVAQLQAVHARRVRPRGEVVQVIDVSRQAGPTAVFHGRLRGRRGDHGGKAEQGGQGAGKGSSHDVLPRQVVKIARRHDG